jgi:Uma2 family endonuclease
MKAIEVRRWTREEYDRMIAAGVFAPGEKVELVDGEILSMTPQGTAHAAAICLVSTALESAFASGFFLRIQLPVATDALSEPEPDLSVVQGSPRDYLANHPSCPVLVVEVADSTLEYDRQRKARIYARAGVQDYWIVNLVDRCVEAYRSPDQGPIAPANGSSRGITSRQSQFLMPGSRSRICFLECNAHPNRLTLILTGRRSLHPPDFTAIPADDLAAQDIYRGQGSARLDGCRQSSRQVLAHHPVFTAEAKNGRALGFVNSSREMGQGDSSA